MDLLSLLGIIKDLKVNRCFAIHNCWIPKKSLATTRRLSAFLDLYLKEVPPDLSNSVTEAMAWSDIDLWWKALPHWNQHARAWRTQLLEGQADGGLAARLLRFVS
jgi:hypothetical protein